MMNEDLREEYADQRSDGNNQQVAWKKRFVFFAVVLALVSLAILVRYGYLMLVPRQSARQAIPVQRSGRGPILDRNGRLLALETRLGNITLWRPGIENSEELCRDIAPLLELSPEELLEKITNSQSDFI
jgi:cell division protein FtsI (penicillin-binding protein 3)